MHRSINFSNTFFFNLLIYSPSLNLSELLFTVKHKGSSFEECCLTAFNFHSRKKVNLLDNVAKPTTNQILLKKYFILSKKKKFRSQPRLRWCRKSKSSIILYRKQGSQLKVFKVQQNTKKYLKSDWPPSVVQSEYWILSCTHTTKITTLFIFSSPRSQYRVHVALIRDFQTEEVPCGHSDWGVIAFLS